MPRKTPVYYNPPQLAVKYCSRPEKTLIWGRGTGKSTVNADIAEACVHEMPRSRGFIVGANYLQILTLELPPMIAHWERQGYYQNLHYFIGKKPPQKWLKKWPTAWHMPQKNDYLIWWYNGSVIQLISFDRKDTGSRGGSFDWGLGIEAALLPKSRLDKELIPAIRPTHYTFKKSRYSKSLTFTSTMPFTQAGNWLFKAEVEQESETIAILGEGLYKDYIEIKKVNPANRNQTQNKIVARVKRKLLAAKAKRKVLYLEATARENLHILGEDYFDTQRRTLSPLVYKVEILNHKVTIIPNSFYPRFKESVHVYFESYSYKHLDSLGFNTKDFKNDCRNDEDLVNGVPLQISLDFNSDIYSLIVFQYLKSVNKVRILKNFYAKDGEGLEELMERFCNYYAVHNNQFVKVWGDRNGYFERDNSRNTYYNEVLNGLGKNRWVSELCAPAHNIEHGLRFIMVNRMFAGIDRFLPQVEINGNNCKELVISIKATPAKKTDVGIQKDKSSERDPNILAEHASHFSDTLDYALFQFFDSAEISDHTSFSFGSL
ncbi:hypothetical protein [Chondrinema litorale]|uniref:hypothetical protein n=1 Tax=Chondrinema litorale TaxID=2994555 RepID=UPI002542D30E|nr:hypothetical protein [Chondrinema litorale]UZR93145.1 hypothetical protein OQ292_14895 [Chondrinema litorale]